MATSSREHGLVQEALPAYEVAGELGRGAFGVVYVGHHRELNREVAIKQLPRAFAADAGVRERFVAEARMVASLDHPHIVPVYDFVNREDGMCLLIMERCAGALSDRFGAEGLATDEACAAVLACCSALDFAHSRGLLHRDIKPENLLYDTAGVVKLGDFGIARALDSNARRTATGLVIGTPAYMSPEQVRGEDLTAASDVYSVGIMAFELMTGRLPFDGATTPTSLLAHHLVTEPMPLVSARAELPAAIGQVVDRSLSKTLEDRQQNALEFAQELTTACVGSFGSGWIRRRRFVLHWPEIISVSEQPHAPGARTGTILVRADESRTLLAAARGDAPVEAPPAVGQPPVPPPPSADTRDAASPAAATGGVIGATIAPTETPAAEPEAEAGSVAFATQAPRRPVAAGGTDAPSSGSRNRVLVGAVIAGLVLVAIVVGVVLASGGSDGERTAAQSPPDSDLTDLADQPEPVVQADGPTPDAAEDAPGDGGEPEPGLEPLDDATPESEPVATAEPAAATTSPEEAEPALEPVVPGEGTPGFGPLTPADTAFVPTPCPRGLERIACIIAVAADADTGEIIAPYTTIGFVPELEPIDHHLHFYLDTVVAGDERKAGTETPGGAWKIWDGILPFTSFGGENGRTGYTLADVAQARARNLCVLVADASHRAIPGTGNCAPIPRVDDDQIALQQVGRLTGSYIGRCGIGATMIVPESWRWLDLTTVDAEEAARLLRPTDVARFEPVLRDLLDSGGILWADGPAFSGDVVNLSVVRVAGDYTATDDPDTVRGSLSQSGIGNDVAFSTREVPGRRLAARVLRHTNREEVQYVIPDFGYALLLSFSSPNAATWQDTSDAIAATVAGC